MDTLGRDTAIGKFHFSKQKPKLTHSKIEVRGYSENLGEFIFSRKVGLSTYRWPRFEFVAALKLSDTDGIIIIEVIFAISEGNIDDGNWNCELDNLITYFILMQVKITLV